MHMRIQWAALRGDLDETMDNTMIELWTKFEEKYR